MHESANEHMMARILANNDELAEHNREHFADLNLWTVNLMSAPGAGKTSLLAVTIAQLTSSRCCVIEGDMVGELDAQRLRQDGTQVFQICTGRSCHLDAQMISRLLHNEANQIMDKDYLFIENVGNLVCPAEFDLGEHKRVVLLSVTEGDDKPIKYPVIFRNCDAVVFTKCDLLPHVDFSLASARQNVRNLNQNAAIFAVSVVDGQGLADWLTWLKSGITSYRSQKSAGDSHVLIGTG